jgi:hypothetical protein
MDGEGMTLPEGWTVEDEPKQKSGLKAGWVVEEDQPVEKPREAPINIGLSPDPEAAKQQGYEPDFSEEVERWEAMGNRSLNPIKAMLSGATFGATENIKALKPEEGLSTDIFKFGGSLLPVSKMLKVANAGAVALAAKSPPILNQLGALYSILGVGAVGATVKGIESLAKGETPDSEELLEHGVQWAFLDAALQGAGVLGKFGLNLYKKSRQLGIPRTQIINDIAERLERSGLDMTKVDQVSEAAFDILENFKPIEGQAKRVLEPYTAPLSKTEQMAIESEILASKEKPITSTDLKLRKIDDRTIKKMETEAPVLAEPVQPEAPSYSAEVKKLEDTVKLMDSVAPRAISEEALGTSIKADVEHSIKAKKAEYKPLYDQAYEAAETLEHTPTGTAREAEENLRELSNLKTKPAGYASVIKNLETVLKDAGYVIKRSANGVIKIIESKGPVPVSKTIELAKRLNEIIDFEAVEPTIKNALKSVKKAAKEDIRMGLMQNPDAHAAFELAEEAHARTAALYTKDSIRKVRGTQAGEKVTTMLDSPTTLKDLKEISTEKQWAQIEREVIDRLNSKPFEAAKKHLREIESSLSKKAKQIAEDIVEAKNPSGSLARRNIVKSNVVEDVADAFTTGQRPKKTLDLWKTKKGQRLVKEAFEGSPNWKQVKTYLEKQSFNDMVASVTKANGVVDAVKIKQFMKDPAFVENVRSQGGEEAVTFFKDLYENITKVRENFNLLDKIPTSYEIGRGQQLLRRTAEKAKEARRVKSATKEIGKDILSPKKGFEKAEQAKALEAKVQRGMKILERMKSKDYPIQAKKQALEELIKNFLGLNAQAAMNVFGLAKLGVGAASGFAFGVPSTVTAIIAYRMLNKMLTSPRVRKAFLEATRHKTNTVGFLLAMEEFGEELD